MTDSIGPIPQRYQHNTPQDPTVYTTCADLSSKLATFNNNGNPPEQGSAAYNDEVKPIKSDVSEMQKLINANPQKYDSLKPLFATYKSDIEDYLQDPRGGLGNLPNSQASVIEWLGNNMRPGR